MELVRIPESVHEGEPSADAMSLRALLVEDFQTHDRKLSSPGFWALAAHRLGRRAERMGSRPLLAAHGVLATGVDWLWGIHIPRRTEVGRRVHIWHFGSVLLNARSIGDDVHLRHDTTFDAVRRADARDPKALPVIESGVDVGSGACVLGPVRVGSGARVGANSVVVDSVAPGATVFGVPSRVIAA